MLHTHTIYRDKSIMAWVSSGNEIDRKSPKWRRIASMRKKVHDLLSLLFNIPERLRFRFTTKKRKETELRHNSMKIKWFFIQFRNELFIYAFIFLLFYNIFIIIKTTVIWWKTYLLTDLINIVSDKKNKNFWSKPHVNLLSTHILRLKLCKKRSTFVRLCIFSSFQ